MKIGEIHWIEVSLLVDGELAEAVAEVLARFAPEGVVIESTAIYADPEDEGHAVGPLRVCAYLPADDQLEATRRKLEEALWYLGRIMPLPEAQFKPVQPVNWVETWKEHYRPIPIGKKLIIVPAWLETPDPARVAVRIDPGMAFGTGTHPTTQLCLELAEPLFEATVPAAVIDLGCGSGILAVAALKLGARHALGVDIDPQAISAAADNARLNGVMERLELGETSLAEIQQGQFSIQSAPLVFANILAPVLVRLLDAGLGDLVTPGGSLILSGILAEQAGDVETALSGHALRLVARRQSGDWVALSASP